MVSKASEDFPEPDSPVITTSLSRGRSTSIFLRLWTRAPRTATQSCAITDEDSEGNPNGNITTGLRARGRDRGLRGGRTSPQPAADSSSAKQVESLGSSSSRKDRPFLTLEAHTRLGVARLLTPE